MISEVLGKLENVVGGVNHIPGQVAKLITRNGPQDGFTKQAKLPLTTAHNLFHIVSVSVVVVQLVAACHERLSLACEIGCPLHSRVLEALVAERLDTEPIFLDS